MTTTTVTKIIVAAGDSSSSIPTFSYPTHNHGVLTTYNSSTIAGILGDNNNTTGVAAGVDCEVRGDPAIVDDFQMKSYVSTGKPTVLSAIGVTMSIRYTVGSIGNRMPDDNWAAVYYATDVSGVYDIFRLDTQITPDAITPVNFSLTDEQALRYLTTSTSPVLSLFPPDLAPYTEYSDTEGFYYVKLYEMTYNGTFTLDVPFWRNLVINPSAEQSFDRAWNASNGTIETGVIWEIPSGGGGGGGG